MRVTDKVKALYQPEVFEGSTARDLIEYNGKLISACILVKV